MRSCRKSQSVRDLLDPCNCIRAYSKTGTLAQSRAVRIETIVPEDKPQCYIRSPGGGYSPCPEPPAMHSGAQFRRTFNNGWGRKRVVPTHAEALVARTCGTTPEQVAEMRSQGMGWGQIARNHMSRSSAGSRAGHASRAGHRSIHGGGHHR